MPARSQVPSGLAATRAIAAVTWKRLLRGRTLWVSGAIAILPVAFAAVLADRQRSTEGMLHDVLAFELLLLAIIPAMFVASSIGEDVEDRTITYLWSRPVPRWAVLAGKLAALTPIACGLLIASWWAAAAAGPKLSPGLASVVAIGGAGLVASLIATGISTLVPRHGMALTICYMLFFDLPVGALPMSLKYLSATYHARVIADLAGQHAQSVGASGIALAVIGALWLGVGLFRIRRFEA
ncbi:MAG: ABC transporter permease [Kofleriaceae bacterium]